VNSASGLSNLKGHDRTKRADQVQRQRSQKSGTETETRGEQDFEKGDQVKEYPVAISLDLNELYGRKE
jgi:hypothetical protein